MAVVHGAAFGLSPFFRISYATSNKALEEAQGKDTALYVIGVGKEIDTGELRNIGRTASFLSTDPAALAKAFEDIAARVESYTKSFYLLSYCSPARAQQHDLKVETGSGLSQGSLHYPFDATGFGPNCDSNRMPKFDIHRPNMKKK